MRDGHLNACIVCVKRDAKGRYERQREEINEKARQRNAASPEPNRRRVRAWARANPERKREQNKRPRTTASHRARIRQVYVEPVNRLVVFKRDHGICGICGGVAVIANFHVDHIIPLSRGGEHSYANAQVAHPRCNLSKYNKVAA